MELVDGKLRLTEIGLIPEDWILITLGQKSKSFSGGTPSTKNKNYYNGNIPWISSAELNQRKIYKTKGHISEEGLNSSSAKMVAPGTFLLAMYGATAGVSAITRINGAINQAVLAIESDEITPEFLLEYFTLNKKDIIEKYCQGGQPNLSSKIVNSIKIPLPPTLEEQKAIANALSDTDALIASLDKLIAKKKAIKQGAMQQLLTPPDKGGKRLPGFDGEWRNIALGELTSIKTGSKNNQDKVEDGRFPFFVRSASIERINSYSYDCEAILIPGEGGIGSIFHYIEGKFEVHQRVYKISDFAENVNGKYIFYQMKHSFGKHAMTNSVKATVDSLRLPTLKNFEVQIPPTIEEQKKIVETLTGMDKEIQVLESKKTKYQQIKQGMMQELLTGRTRLI